MSADPPQTSTPCQPSTSLNSSQPSNRSALHSALHTASFTLHTAHCTVHCALQIAHFVKSYKIWNVLLRLNILSKNQVYSSKRLGRGRFKNKPPAQTLADATPHIGKILPFSKIAITFEPMIGFRFPFKFRMF